MGPGPMCRCSTDYSERGEAPGQWLGGGLGNLDLVAGQVVTEPQMRALLGRGVHPDAEAIIARVITAKQAEDMSRKAAKKHALSRDTAGRDTVLGTAAVVL